MSNKIRLIACLWIFITGSSVYAQTYEELNEKGVQAFVDRNYEDALLWFDKAIEANKDFAQGYGNRGYTYYNLGDNNKAIEDISKAIQMMPDSAGNYINRSEVYMALGDYRNALSDLDKCISLLPDQPLGYYLRGNTYAAQFLYDKAIADYSKSISFAEWSDSYFQRGLMHNRTGRDDLALTDYNKAIELDPKYSFPYINKAQTISHTPGKTEDAVRILLDAIDKGVFENDPWGFASIGDLYIGAENYSEASKYFDKAINDGLQVARIFNNKATSAYYLGNYDEALNACNKTIELDPNYINAYVNRCRIYEKKGNPERGLQDADKALSLEPDNIEALAAKGICLYRMGRIDDAAAIQDRIDRLQGN